MFNREPQRVGTKQYTDLDTEDFGNKYIVVDFLARVQLVIWSTEFYDKSYGQSICYNIS